MQLHRSAIWAGVIALSGCAGDGEGLDENGRPVEDQPDDVLVAEFDSIQTNVLTPVCTTCHSGAAAPLGLRLDEGASFALLVNTPSTEVPELLRVDPGNPDASYLIQKIEGTAAVGGRMPLGGSALPPDTIAVIRQWILEGAQPSAAGLNASLKPSPSAVTSAWPLEGAVLNQAPAIVIAARSELNTSLLEAGTVTLRRSGGDADFANGNESDLSISIQLRSYSPTVMEISAPKHEWIPDEYRLRLSAGAPLAITDLASLPIDGDADGEAGGDFVLNFSIEDVQ